MLEIRINGAPARIYRDSDTGGAVVYCGGQSYRLAAGEPLLSLERVKR